MKFSIITINKNNAAGLEKTIKSVINQTFKDFEYIIIDGKSDDNSVEIIKKYQDHIDFWISEPDTGIYNAMNKGIKIANGDYLLFLNSGDYFFNNKILEDVFNLKISEDIVYGDLLINKKFEVTFPDSLTLKYFTEFKGLPHQATFIKKELFKKYGLYDEKYKFLADWKFFLDMIILKNVSYKHIKKIITNYFTGGASSSKEASKEFEPILFELFPRIYPDYIFFRNELRNLRLYRNNKLFKFILKFLKIFKSPKYLPQ